MSTVDVLRAARALITPAEKWTTGQLCTRDGRMCALGAVGIALWGDQDAGNWPEDAYGALEREPSVHVLAKAAGADEHDTDMCDVVYITNDESDGPAHHAIVLDLFDRAIALAESE